MDRFALKYDNCWRWKRKTTAAQRSSSRPSRVRCSTWMWAS